MAERNPFEVTLSPAEEFGPPTPAQRPIESANPFEVRLGGGAGFPGPTRSPVKPQHNRVFGELKPSPEGSPSEKVTDYVRNKFVDWGAHPYNAEWMARAATGIASLAPPVGAPLAAADLTHDVPKGNVVASVLDALGVVPGVKALRRTLPPSFGSILSSPVPESIPAYKAPFRETRRAAPEIGGFVTPLPNEMRAAGSAGYSALEQAPLIYHPDAMRNAIDRARVVLPNAQIGGASHTPESATGVFSTLDRFYGRFPGAQTAPPPAAMSALTGVGANPATPAARPVTAHDFDQLRKDLIAVGKSDPRQGAAVRQATDVIDASMLYPRKDMILQGENLLPELRAGYVDARGNWRGYKTSGAVVDAQNTSRIKETDPQNAFNKFIATPEGKNKIFGATPAQLDALEGVAVGDRTTRGLNKAGDVLSGQGTYGRTIAAGIPAALGGAGAYFMGHGWPTVAGATIGAPSLTQGAGAILHGIANRRTVQQGERVADEIARASPLGQANLANPINAPVAGGDARTRAVDAITTALLSQEPRKSALDWWNTQYVPYEFRDGTVPDSVDDPLKITVTPPTSR